MSSRIASLFASIVLALATVVLVAPTAQAEVPEPCYGGVIAETDSAGELSGTACSDVIVAGSDTTVITGGAGDDVIIGAPNTVLIEAGGGWDLVIGNSFSTIIEGGGGNDIIDASAPTEPDEVTSSVQDQIDLAVSAVPLLEGEEFEQDIDQQLLKTQSRGGTNLNLKLRQEAIESTVGVQRVIGTVDEGSESMPSDEVVALDFSTEALPAKSGRAIRELAEGSGASAMSREWGGNTQYGDEGNDILYGGRGTDEIYGRLGNDLIYGGIEDDELYGNGGNDYLLGGFGSDDIQGGPDDDVVQGDATGDKMIDSSGTDTLSFASGGIYGFGSPSMSGFPNFPAPGSSERGIYIDLSASVANNGSVVGGGGGTDKAATGSDPGTVFSDFENVIGTPFADYIVGNSGLNILEGGGGSDVIYGGTGSADVLIGDAGGDNLSAPAGSWLVGGPGSDYCGTSPLPADCESNPSNWVGVRNFTKISVGMTSPNWAGNWKSQIYMAGSTTDWFSRNGEDDVTVTQLATSPPSFQFNTTASTSKGQFSTQPEDMTPGCTYSATQVTCSPSTNTVTLVLSGFGSNDNLNIVSVGQLTDPVFLGGDGYDVLTGGNNTDDFMHDGSADDVILGQAGDDGFVNTSGSDTINGGVGDDLVESNSACEDDELIGGGNFDSASWVQYRTGSTAGSASGVLASIYSGNVGRFEGGALTCSGEGAMNSINQFEDLEGSRHRDELRGDDTSNQLIGRATSDVLKSYNGEDRILANSQDNDTVDCGAPSPSSGGDIGVIDYPANGTDTTANCEIVNFSTPIFPTS